MSTPCSIGELEPHRVQVAVNQDAQAAGVPMLALVALHRPQLMSAGSLGHTAIRILPLYV